jgi:Holliday junction resolvase
MSEAATQRAILDYLRLRGIWAMRVQSGRLLRGGRAIQLADEGTPDILGCTQDGKLLAIEVKSQTGALRTAQATTLERLRRHGAVVVVARGIEDVEEVLR